MDYMYQPNSYPDTVISPDHGSAILQVYGEMFVEAPYVRSDGEYPVRESRTERVKIGTQEFQREVTFLSQQIFQIC